MWNLNTVTDDPFLTGNNNIKKQYKEDNRHLKKVRNSMIDRGAYFTNITAGWMVHFGKVNFIVYTVG